MASGTVTASTSLNLRDAPNGNIVGQLAPGSSVTILDGTGEWLKVSTPAGDGFVSSQFISLDDAPADAVPPPDDGNIRSDSTYAYAPDGSVFANRSGAGFYNYGKTTVDSFVTSVPDAVHAFSPSMLQVVRAVSANEGKLEAINSYDSNFMSFGIFQWTAGGLDQPGEVAALLARVKQADPAVFQDLFGSYKLDTTVRVTGGVTTGFLTLAGNSLKSTADKSCLRNPEWAYRFWRAGHHAVVRTCQIEHAMSRIDAFYDDLVVTTPSTGSMKLKDFISSEYGIALILDEHVNRPGHVPGTLTGAINQYFAQSNRIDPSQWSTDDETKVLAAYLDLRTQTSMTDSAGRARKIAASGLVSPARGSFRRV